MTIFYEFLIFYDLILEPLGKSDMKNSEIWEAFKMLQ